MNALEVRQKILETVSRNGGHLASSLGAVEIALALRKVFDPEKDRIVWDVGHQAYAWKILTDRADSFHTLRKLGGLSGFPSPMESKCDAAIAGHAGVAISVAEGLAVARDRKGTGEHVVAVVGDASIVNGSSFEAISNCSFATRRLIVVLNDNEAPASRPFLKSALFEDFGLHYMGPIDGHDVDGIVSALTAAKAENRPVLLHVVTEKGRGFGPAEKNPSAWHGVGPFKYPDSAYAELPADARADVPRRSWSDAFGDALREIAREDDRVVAITAAMRDGTGLAGFAEEFPDRFFDVGIAEGHMVAFAGGLAAGGLRPFVAVYSTFLQRAVDQVMHDVAIANLPVVICVDRAGVVGADGVTHQGLYDIAMLRCLPNVVICQPKDADDMKSLLREALKRNGPTVMRYPRGKMPDAGASDHCSGVPSPAGKIAIWATGDWYGKACEAAARVGGVAVHARYIKPFDAKLLAGQRAAGMVIASLENASVAGGLGEAIGADVKLGWPDEFIPHGGQDELERKYGLDLESVVNRLAAFVARQPSASGKNDKDS